MDSEQIVSAANTKLSDSVAHFQGELKAIRTGRANAAMLDGIMVEAYGTPMPLNQVANVVAADATLLQVTPFDPNNLEAISDAIRKQPNLGLNPSDDGRIIRLPIPPLTEERRKEIAKQIGERLEDCLVRMRSSRHEAMNAIDQLKKDKSIGEDEAKRQHKRIEDLMSEQRKRAEDAARDKEKEILTL